MLICGMKVVKRRYFWSELLNQYWGLEKLPIMIIILACAIACQVEVILVTISPLAL